MNRKPICRVLLMILGLLAMPLVAHAQVDNLAPNGSFEEDEVIQDDPAYDQWWTWGWEAGLQGRCNIVESEAIDGARSLRIEPKGGTTWYYIVANSPIALTVGKTYTASFWVKAEAPRAVTAKWKVTDNSDNGYGETNFQVTTEWAEYYTTAKAQNAEIKFEFHCAAVDTPFWLDFFNVYEGEYRDDVTPGGAGGQARAPKPGDGAVVDQTRTELQWREGSFAVLHDVYFGDDREQVAAATRDDTNVFFGRQPGTVLTAGVAGGPFPNGLVPGTTYYWRVDEVNDADPASPWKGDVWSFIVRPLTAWDPYPPDAMRFVDPNENLTWQKGAGTVIFHSIFFGDNAETVKNATKSNWMSTTPTYEPGTLQLDKTYYWRIDEFMGATTRKGNVWSFTTRGTGGGVTARYFKGMELAGDPILTQTEGSINHNWAGEIVGGLSDDVSARWTANLEAPFTETYKIITTSDDGVRLWFDGRLVIDNWTDHGSVDNTATVNLIAGQVYHIRMEWYENTGGAVAQLSWESPSLPRQIIPQGWLQLPLHAAGASPAHAEPHAVQDAVLQWIAGEEATDHDVYFGDDATAVAGADTTTAGIYKGRQAVDETTFDPGNLEWGKTYYWRVDEINAANAASPWKGNVWSFTVADFLIVDDFESYNDEEGQGTRIYETWADGYSDGSSGSIVGYVDPPFAEQRIVNSGYQSMPLDYNNVNAPFYSEAKREWSTAQNWTVNGVDSLTLYFRGKPKNGPEKLYVTLADSAGKSATVVNTNAAAATATQWTEWTIPLSSFTGVNAAKIKSLIIGLGDRSSPKKGGAGRLYIDDIRVTQP